MSIKIRAFVLTLIVLTATGWSAIGLLARDTGAAAQAAAAAPTGSPTDSSAIVAGSSYHNDTSRALRAAPLRPQTGSAPGAAREAMRAPARHKDAPDAVVQSALAPAAMPAPSHNFDGIGYPGVGCNCSPPDTNGEVGGTQYVQLVNQGLQVFDKASGTSLLGPLDIGTLWGGFGGLCETNGAGDPVVLYDQLADRWLISQFAGGNTITDECVAVSSSADATGGYYRYGFHLGSNFYDYPHLGLWPDAYYMSMNVFNAAGTAYLGPQPFAFDRTKMLLGQPAGFQATANTLGDTVAPLLPADLDGAGLPPAGAPETFLRFPDLGSMDLYHYHVDWANPAASSFSRFATPPAAPFTTLCPITTNCVPQAGTTIKLDGIGDRLMFRLAYRKFADGQESLVGNYTVSSNNTAGIRWFELRNPTNGPVTVFQQSTYQPDGTWRWMGSAAMDRQGNLALGFSAAAAGTYPQIRYAGRLAGDPLNTLAQGEATLIAGSGAQTSGHNRWGDYSDLTVDPSDDCTFWYTTEYYQTTAPVAWKTRIGSFKFPNCAPEPTVTATPAAPTATPTACAAGVFSDVPATAYFAQAVGYLASHSVISGYSDCTFRPYTQTTRGQMTKIVVLGFNLPITTAGGPHFSDVAPGDVFYPFIETAVNRGIVSGYSDGTFRPSAFVSRGQLAKIVVGAAAWALVTPARARFSDVPVGSTFSPYVETAYCHAVLDGYSDGTFLPAANAFRGQVAKIVYLSLNGGPDCSR